MLGLQVRSSPWRILNFSITVRLFLNFLLFRYLFFSQLRDSSPSLTFPHLPSPSPIGPNTIRHNRNMAHHLLPHLLANPRPLHRNLLSLPHARHSRPGLPPPRPPKALPSRSTNRPLLATPPKSPHRLLQRAGAYNAPKLPCLRGV